MSLEAHERAVKWTQVRTQEIGSILDEAQEMCVNVSTTNVRCVVASECGFRLGHRLAREKDHDGRRGKHVLRHMSCLQALGALSSREAEYYALIRGACAILGIQSHYQDWMTDVSIGIYNDS